MGSFSWKTARTMMTEGFAREAIPSDVHAFCLNGPAYDQVTTLSKFLALGMRLSDVIAAQTINAAAALKRPALGLLEPGSVGDASILSLDEGRFPHEDVGGEVVMAGERPFARGVVMGGRRRRSQEETAQSA
jgi:dihydroorotase